MRSTAPELLPILRSRHLAEMLTLLLLHPDAEYTLSEVAGKLGLPLTTVRREATRLSGSGLIQERRVGRSRLVSANPASRYTRPLTELVSLAFGPSSPSARNSVPSAQPPWRSTDRGPRAMKASRARAERRRRSRHR
jgi:DNA-binding transcriptional ArsR family regulator